MGLELLAWPDNIPSRQYGPQEIFLNRRDSEHVPTKLTSNTLQLDPEPRTFFDYIAAVSPLRRRRVWIKFYV